MPAEGHDHDSGPTEPLTTGYRVRYRRPARTGAAVLLLPVLPAVTGLLLLHVLWPTHWTQGGSGRRWLVLADSLTLVSVGLFELFLLANVAAVAYALSVARDPVPVAPGPGTRLALLTTCVPGAEPLSAVRTTLEAAVLMRYPGPLDVWLLDEGDDPEARMLCAELGVHHFTRLGVPEWNRGRARTRPVRSAGTSTPGSPNTETPTTSSCAPTPATSRGRKPWSGRPAGSVTRTSPSSWARGVMPPRRRGRSSRRWSSGRATATGRPCSTGPARSYAWRRSARPAASTTPSRRPRSPVSRSTGCATR